MKICSKFTGEKPCRSAISIKLQSTLLKTLLKSHFDMGVLQLHIFRTPFPKNTIGGLLLQHAWRMTKVHRDFPILWGLWCVNSFQTSDIHFFHVLGVKTSCFHPRGGQWLLKSLISWIVQEFFGAWNVLEKCTFLAVVLKLYLNSKFLTKSGSLKLRKILKTSRKIPFPHQLKENFRKAINTDLNKSYDQ